MYLEYLVTIAAIVKIASLGIVSIAAIALVKIVAEAKKTADEEKTKRLFLSFNKCDCDHESVIEITGDHDTIPKSQSENDRNLR